MMIINLITGLSIWGAAGLMSDPLAEISHYGPLIASIHAETWAVPLSIGAALHLFGQVVNGDPRLSAWVTPAWRLVGAILCFGVMALFCLGGFFVEIKLFTVIHFIQSFVVSVICAWFVALAWSDLRAAL